MKGWKTIAFNVITALLLVAEKMGADFGIADSVIATVALVGNFILRFLTTTPVGKSS